MGRISLLLCFSILFSCSNVTSENGIEIINKSIERHGGKEVFRELQSVSFSKTTRLYKEDGLLESETVQKQSFQLQPDYLLKIKWEQGSVIHEIIYNGITTLKKTNDSIVENSIEVEKATRTALAADYVFFQPFRLLDKDARLSYKGIQTINDSIETSVVGVSYNDDIASSDAWKYYFDTEFRLVAASVAHDKRISLIENLDFQTYKGVLFNKHRKSYFVDSLLQKKYLRAEYLYNIIETRQ